jgi:hypothetical protein
VIFKKGKNKVKPIRTTKSDNRRCISCVQSCSMSGLCMKPWPIKIVVKKEDAK